MKLIRQIHRSRSTNFFGVKIISYLLVQTRVLGAQKNRFIETILLSIHNVLFRLSNKNCFLITHTILRSANSLLLKKCSLPWIAHTKVIS